MLLERIAGQIGLPINLWYDINCRYKGHAVSWATAKQQELGPMVSSWITQVMAYPLPPMHYQMHDIPCQLKNSYLSVEFAGVGAGEPTEIAWSHFRKAGHILQYQSLSGRAVGIEKLVRNWNRTKRQGCIKFLWDASQRAEAKIQLAEREIQELIGLLLASGLSQDEVCSDALKLFVHCNLTTQFM